LLGKINFKENLVLILFNCLANYILAFECYIIRMSIFFDVHCLSFYQTFLLLIYTCNEESMRENAVLLSIIEQ